MVGSVDPKDSDSSKVNECWLMAIMLGKKSSWRINTADFTNSYGLESRRRV